MSCVEVVPDNPTAGYLTVDLQVSMIYLNVIVVSLYCDTDIVLISLTFDIISLRRYTALQSSFISHPYRLNYQLNTIKITAELLYIHC